MSLAVSGSLILNSAPKKPLLAVFSPEQDVRKDVKRNKLLMVVKTLIMQIKHLNQRLKKVG
jgi:hypothetical protein